MRLLLFCCFLVAVLAAPQGYNYQVKIIGDSSGFTYDQLQLLQEELVQQHQLDHQELQQQLQNVGQQQESISELATVAQTADNGGYQYDNQLLQIPQQQQQQQVNIQLQNLALELQQQQLSKFDEVQTEQPQSEPHRQQHQQQQHHNQPQQQQEQQHQEQEQRESQAETEAQHHPKHYPQPELELQAPVETPVKHKYQPLTPVRYNSSPQLPIVRPAPAQVPVPQPQALPQSEALPQPQALFQSEALPQPQDLPQYTSTQYNKEFYYLSAPQEDFDLPQSVQHQLNQIKRNLRVVFIKAPEQNGIADAALQLAKQSVEGKTAIYVLSKQHDASELTSKLQQIRGAAQRKPEVVFIKYKTPAEAEHAQRTIQAQYEALEGPNHFNHDGVAPTHNFVGSVAVDPRKRTSSISSAIEVDKPGAKYLPAKA